MSFSRTFHNIIVENEMALKSPSNTATVWGAWSPVPPPPPSGPGQNLDGGPGDKAPGGSRQSYIL